MRRLGQHFLKNRSALYAIAEALELSPNDTVIEIGPGHGELTRVLRAASLKTKIVAVEKDRGLAEKLKNDFTADDGIDIREGDALVLLPALTRDPKFKDRNYKIAGNIPYYITGHLLKIVGEIGHGPVRCVFTIQKEVADRLCAQPPHMNRLAASIQFWANPKIIRVLPASDFNPPPKVASAIVSLETKPVSALGPAYYATVHALFAQPRKTIINNLAGSIEAKRDVLAKKLLILGIAPNDRPQNLSIKNIIEAAKVFF